MVQDVFQTKEEEESRASTLLEVQKLRLHVSTLQQKLNAQRLKGKQLQEEKTALINDVKRLPLGLKNKEKNRELQRLEY